MHDLCNGACIYGLSIGLVVAFGGAACFAALSYRQTKGQAESSEFFLTARKSADTLTVAWSFYSAAMGSWVLFGPPSFCLTAGILGTITYALFTGLPILLVAVAGTLIQQLAPDVISLGDFVRQRFGRPASLYVSLILLFNMAVGMAAEYTALGDLFLHVLALPRLPILLVTGAVPMLYSALGGFHATIVTDRWQAQAGVLLLLLLSSYVVLTHPSVSRPLPARIAWRNPRGLSSLFVMPVALSSTALLSEAMWQRCWASASPSALFRGSLLASLAAALAVLAVGMGGVLAVWSGDWQPSSPADPGNTVLFSLIHHRWVLIAVTLLAVTMSEAAIGAFQTALLDTVAVAAEVAAELQAEWRLQAGGWERLVTSSKLTGQSRSHGGSRAAKAGRRAESSPGSSSIGGDSDCSTCSRHCRCRIISSSSSALAGGPSSLHGLCSASLPCPPDCAPRMPLSASQPLLEGSAAAEDRDGRCALAGPAAMCGAEEGDGGEAGPSGAPDPAPHLMSVAWIRLLLPLLSLPSLLLALLDLNILLLFLAGNIINTATCLPVLAGLIPGQLARHVITPVAVVAGSASGVAAAALWVATAGGSGDGRLAALYEWQPFLLALGFSLLGMAAGRIGEEATRRCGVLRREGA